MEDEQILLIVFVRQERAYIPTLIHVQGQFGLVMAEPVGICALTASALAKTLEQMYQQGNPEIPSHSPGEIQKRYPDPLPKAVGVTSERALRKGAAEYRVRWGGEGVVLDMPNTRRPLELVDGPTVRFPPDTSFESIAETIVRDLQSRFT